MFARCLSVLLKPNTLGEFTQILEDTVFKARVRTEFKGQVAKGRMIGKRRMIRKYRHLVLARAATDQL